MNRKNHVFDETKDTIITGYGQHPSKLDDGDDNISFVTLDGPQATSTVGTKKSRHDIIEEYLKSLEDIVETKRSDELESKTGNQLPSSHEKSEPGLQKILGSVVKPLSKLQRTNFRLRDSGGSEDSTSLSLINVDEMNSLSASKFLVDHTQLLPKRTLGTSRDQTETLTSGVNHSDDEYDIESAAQKFTQQELENLDADLSDSDESDLSQGALNYDKKGNDGIGGLPSFLLERNESLLREAQISQEKTPRDCPFQSKVHIQNESSFCGNNLNFDGLEVSARSTMVCGGLERSKLLSGSCNSLGSLGASAVEDFGDDLSVQSSRSYGGDSDPFSADQVDLAGFLKDETYQMADTDMFDEAERENAKMNIFLKEDLCTGSKQNDTFLSGIYEIKEITVRPSWIPSPDKELLGPGNKMNIEDYLMLRSGSLGKLGDDDDYGEGGVDIGIDAHSPPSENKAIRLVDMSAINHMSYSYLQPEGEMMEVEIADHLEQSKACIKDNESSLNESSCTSTFRCHSSTSGSSSSESMTFEASSRCDSGGAVPKNRTPNCSRYKNVTNGKTSLIQGALSLQDKNANTKFGQLPLPAAVRCEANKNNFLQSEEKVDNEANDQLSEQIRHILSDPLINNDPQAIVKRIIQMRQTNSSELHETLVDKSDLDISSEVLELRAKKEELIRKLQRKENKDTIGKENINSSLPKYQQNRNRLPLHPTTIVEKKNINQLPNKHMEKLNVQRTSSAPENVHLHCHLKDQSLDTKLAELVMDESVRGIPYKSRILEDSQKSHLVSFHDSTNSGFDSSTPCAPRSLTKQNVHKPSQLCRIGDQLYIEDKRPANSTAIQRPLPKMGLGSNLVRISGTDNIYAVNNHNALSLLSSRSETTVYSNSDGRSISDSSSEEAVRSSSMPSGLQALGVASSLLKPVTSGSQRTISPRQHQSQENVNTYFYHKGLEERVVLPQRVEYPNICILGIASENIITFRNIKQRWVQLSIRLMQETVDNNPVTTSALYYKSSYFVEPQNSCDIKLSLCGQFAGSWEAVMEVQVLDVAKGKGTASDVSIHTIILSAQIEEPSIQLLCKGEDEVNFDIVPESCVVCREVTIINQSPQPIPVVLTLQKVAATAPVFFWDIEENETLKVVSPTCLACELPPSDPEKGPILRNFRVFIKAPHLERVKVDESGIFKVTSQIQVQLDSPNQPTIIIAILPVKAFVGAVHLQTLRISEPLVMVTTADKSCNVSIPVKNSSTFPIHLSVEPRDHKDVFSAHPNLVVIQPYSLSTVNVAFTPKGKTGSMETVLLMCVEPKGILYSMSIVGKSSAAPAELTGHLVPIQRTHSAPLKSQADLSTALESTKSRIVFGTVGVGEQTWQKLVIRNSCVSQSLSLVIGVRGSKAFQICELGCDDGKNCLNAVLEPCQELSLSVFFSPTSVEACSASLIFKPRGVSDPIKFQISLQGYGGRSKLRFVDIAECKPLLIRDISPQQSGMLHTALANTGDRDMFLKILAFHDEKCTELVSKTDILIQPSDFVLKPKENRDVIIMVHGSPQILGKTPGCIGYLVIISGDEILRRRFRRHTNQKVKTKRVNDPSLLQISWNEFFSGEKGSENEEIGLPLQPEDAMVFYNSCSRIQVQLNGERQSSDEASSTVFAGLDAEDTMSSIANLSIFPDRINDGDSPLVQTSKKNVSSAEPNRAETLEQSQSWDIFPQSLSIPYKDLESRTFVVVNFTNKQQMLEVTSSSRWLHIEPREAILGSLGTVQVVVRLIQPRMPQPVLSSIVDTIKIMCENEIRSATITVTPDGTGSSNATGLPKITPSVTVTPPDVKELSPSPVYQHPSSKIPSQSVHSSDFLQSTLQSTNKADTVKGNVKKSQVMTKVTTDKHVSGSSLPPGSQHKEVEPNISSPVETCLVELVTSSVVYPDTAASKENMMKVKLRNLARIDHLVKAEVTNLPFAIRHHHFVIKSEHFVTIPVYFRPQRVGVYNGYLRLTVVKDQKVLTVNLSGTAV